MSSLILITGTLYEGRDLKHLLDAPIAIEENYPDPVNENIVQILRKPFPLEVFGQRRFFDIVQGVSCGKTFYAVNLLAQKTYSQMMEKGYADNCFANLGLAWRTENVGKPDSEWVASLTSIEQFESLSNCTILLDDVSTTIPWWNSEQARAISAIANAQGKLNKDIIITAQRENQIPPAIRDMATEWIVPIITSRDFTRPTPRNDGYPLAMITLHFNGSKGLEYIGDTIIGFERVFRAYKTVEIAKRLESGESVRINQNGVKLELEAFDWLKEKIPSLNWQHLNGKGVFDIICDTCAIDVVGTDEDGRAYTDGKNLLKHIRTAKGKGQKPYLMLKHGGDWAFVPITYRLNETVAGKKVNFNQNQVKRLNTLLDKIT